MLAIYKQRCNSHIHLANWSDMTDSLEHKVMLTVYETINIGPDYGSWLCDRSNHPAFLLHFPFSAPVLAFSYLAWHGSLWPCVVEEKTRSKADEQPWKNTWAENGRDICQEAFHTGLTSSRVQGSSYPTKNADMKEGAMLIHKHGLSVCPLLALHNQ